MQPAPQTSPKVRFGDLLDLDGPLEAPWASVSRALREFAEQAKAHIQKSEQENARLRAEIQKLCISQERERAHSKDEVSNAPSDAYPVAPAPLEDPPELPREGVNDVMLVNASTRMEPDSEVESCEEPMTRRNTDGARQVTLTSELQFEQLREKVRLATQGSFTGFGKSPAESEMDRHSLRNPADVPGAIFVTSEAESKTSPNALWQSRKSHSWTDMPDLPTEPSPSGIPDKSQSAKELATPTRSTSANRLRPQHIVSPRQSPRTPSKTSNGATVDNFELKRTVRASVRAPTDLMRAPAKKPDIRRSWTTDPSPGSPMLTPSGLLGKVGGKMFGPSKKESSKEISSRDSAKDVDRWTMNDLYRRAGRQPGGFFPQADEMKKKVRAGVCKPDYDVTNFYKDAGIPQRIARSIYFEYLTLGVIGLNAIWIAVDIDLNPGEGTHNASAFFLIVENMFLLYFLTEIMIRYMAFAESGKAVRDGWFVFDSTLVFFAVADTWMIPLIIELSGGHSSGIMNSSALRLLRLMRLTRMARMVRLLRAVPELMILIKGLRTATRSVLLTLVLLAFIIYLFALALRQLTKDTDIGEQYFSSVPHASLNLLLGGIVPDMEVFIRSVGEAGWVYFLILLVFVFVAALTVMNMLIGILCEVVSVVATVEREQMTVNSVKQNVLRCLQKNGIKITEGTVITRSQVEGLLLVPEAARQIQEVGVDVVGLVDYLDVIFCENAMLSFPDFFEVLLQLRGSNTATVKDIVDLRKLMTQVLHLAQGHNMGLSLDPGPGGKDNLFARSQSRLM